MLIPRPFDVWIEPIFDPDKIGSLYVPDMAKERCDQGVIKYVGERCRWLKVGDYVLFSGYSGETVELDGEGLLICMAERQVLAVIGDADWGVTKVPGLYYRERDRDNNIHYFSATLESALRLIAQAQSNFVKIRYGAKEKMINYRPAPEDILLGQEDWDDFYEESNGRENNESQPPN